MNVWQKNLLIAVGCIAAFYGLVCADVMLRAREAWTEGEKYWRWADHPAERDAFLKQEFEKDKAALDKKLADKKIIPEDHSRDLELLQFAYEQKKKESSIKYAYVWYQTAAELFTPPESKWVRLSREKMPLAKDRWRAELKAQNIPFEESMLD